MRVTIIGTGNTATVLGKTIFHHGHVINEVAGRDESDASTLAAALGATPVTDLQHLNAESDIYILCLSDNALHTIAETLHLPGKLVVHTAGSIPMNILQPISANHGVLYPLQSLRKELADVPPIPILIDANNPWNKTKLSAFAQSFAYSVDYADDLQRKQLHLAAVITNNFANHLFALAEDFCRKEGINFKLLLPLLRETVHRLDTASAADVQTGPASRNDEVTINHHKEMLKNYPALLKLYGVMSESIQSMK